MSLPSSNRRMPLSRRIPFYAIVLGIQVVVTLALLEVAARIFDPIGISYYPNTAAFMDTMILEEPIGYRNRPGLEGNFYFHPVTINSIGLRHRELELAPDPSKYRILLVGDSVVFGVGVADEDTIARQLEDRLRENEGEIDGRAIEVVNMGVISYNTEQEMIQYRQLGQQLGPDLVLLVFSENDIEPKMWIFKKRSNSLVTLGQRSYAISLLFALWRNLKDLVWGQQPRIRESAYQEGDPQWESIASSMRELNRMTGEANVPFVLFPRNNTSDSWPLLVELAEREGFPHGLLLPARDPRWRHIDFKKLHSRGGAGHLNREGLSMYATLIHEELRSMNMLGATRETLEAQR